MGLDFGEIKALLVDDDENFAFAMKMLLGNKGLNIQSISDPKKALEFLKENKVNIILLDYYMPEMTGEEFLKKLRDFDKTTIVFLQTAYSQEKPELEMLSSLNIQGYIDKNKDPNDIFLDIVSGIKMAKLIEEIQNQKKEIAILNYKNSIIGSLITNLVNDSKDQLLQISAMNESIRNDTDSYTDENNIIKNALEKIYDLYEALNFDETQFVTAISLKKNIEKLLRPTIILHNINFSFDLEYENRELSYNDLFLVIKIVELLAEGNIKDININIFEENSDIYLKISTSKSVRHINFSELDMFENNIEVGENYIRIYNR